MRYRDLIIIVRISYDTRQVGAYEISSIYYLKINKKALDHVSKTLLVEHLEKSSPLIIEEIHRWHNLLWDDYLEYMHQQKDAKKLGVR